MLCIWFVCLSMINKIPAFVLQDRCMHNRGLDPTVKRGPLQRGEADSRSKMRPVIMMVESNKLTYRLMIQPGQHYQLYQHRCRMAKPDRIWVREGGYCSDTQHEEKLQEKEGQHQGLQTALEDHGYQVSTIPIILGVSGSHFHTTTQAFKQIGLSHYAAKTLLLKLHEHSITCLHSIVTSRRV